jgi:hypothetical protein
MKLKWTALVSLLSIPFVFFSSLGWASPVFSATGSRGSAATLVMEGGSPSSATISGLFCDTRKSILSKAELWMPDMDHGSSPTFLNRTSEGCTQISDMDFFMPGLWEIRMETLDKETFVFTFDVRN